METDKSLKKNKSSAPQRFLLDWYVVYHRSVIKRKHKKEGEKYEEITVLV